MGGGTQARRTAAGGRASNRVTNKGVAIGCSHNHESYETYRRQQSRHRYIGIGHNIFGIAFRYECVKYDTNKESFHRAWNMHID